MTINELVKKAHKNAKSKGFWDKPRELGTLLMLITSELGEALEADRNGKYVIESDFDDFENISNFEFEKKIKDWFEDELADVFIRLADLCGAYGINIEKFIKAKMKYNSSRERLHGKQY